MVWVGTPSLKNVIVRFDHEILLPARAPAMISTESMKPKKICPLNVPGFPPLTIHEAEPGAPAVAERHTDTSPLSKPSCKSESQTFWPMDPPRLNVNSG